MKKRSLNKIKQMVSIGMSCIMAGSTCNLPMMLHAEEVQTENMHPTDEACPVKDEPQAQDGCALHEWENGKCRVCGYICKHTGGTATCTKKAVCTECGIEYGEVDSKNHDILYHAAQAPTCTKNGYEAY